MIEKSDFISILRCSGIILFSLCLPCMLAAPFTLIYVQPPDMVVPTILEHVNRCDVWVNNSTNKTSWSTVNGTFGYQILDHNITDYQAVFDGSKYCQSICCVNETKKEGYFWLVFPRKDPDPKVPLALVANPKNVNQPKWYNTLVFLSWLFGVFGFITLLFVLLFALIKVIDCLCSRCDHRNYNEIV